MQALHSKLDVVLVQILRYNCLGWKPITDFARICPSRTPPCTRMRGFTLRPLHPPLFFFAPQPLFVMYGVSE